MKLAFDSEVVLTVRDDGVRFANRDPIGGEASSMCAREGSKIRIFLVDDLPADKGVANILSDEQDFLVVGHAENGEMLRQATSTNPDLIVIDTCSPGKTGIDTCRELIRQLPGVKVMIITSAPLESTIIKAFAAGAQGLVVENADAATLRQAVRVIVNGQTYIDPRIAGKIIALATKTQRVRGPFGLTLQEMRIVELLPRGLTNRELGKELGIAEETVKIHIRNAKRKLGAKHRAEAAAIARREGLA